MGKYKALETARKKKLLSSHEHLKKCIFQPSPPVHAALWHWPRHQQSRLPSAGIRALGRYSWQASVLLSKYIWIITTALAFVAPALAMQACVPVNCLGTSSHWLHLLAADARIASSRSSREGVACLYAGGDQSVLSPNRERKAACIRVP